jgi:hypothetical protein
VQPLQPWAIILGHEKEEKKVMKFPVRKKRAARKKTSKSINQ